MRTTTSFKLAIEIFLIRKSLISDHFDKLAFSLNKNFTDDVMFSHADTLLTGCPLDAIIIKFRAHRRLICCYPPRMSRETWVGMSMAFSSSMKISRVCSVQYVPRDTAGITGTGHFGKFGTTSRLVPDTWVSSVRHQYRYRSLR